MPVIRGSRPIAADTLAAIASVATAVGSPTATARRLGNASLSDNTRRAYACAVRRLETGRSLNIAPQRWQKTFDPLRDALD